MSEQYPGGFITKSPTEPTTTVAKGMWTLSQAAGYRKQSLWPTSPGAPTIGTATGGDTTASVAFTAPANAGSAAITSYTATSSPGGFTGTGSSSPITVSGLTNGTAYTFTVTATNGAGTGPASAASNSVTPELILYMEDLFSTWLYTGNSGSQTVTNSINLSTNGGLVWIKSRNYAGTGQFFQDTVRGANQFLDSTSTGANQDIAAVNTVFSTTGFSQNNNYASFNESAYNYVSWTFREQPKFFDIVTYTGTGTTMTVPHNLGAVPGCMIVKGLNAASAWDVYHQSLGPTQVMRLSTTAATSGQPQWDNTAPTSTVFTVKGGETANVSGRTYVAYLFASDAGSFPASGGGSTNGITCGSYTCVAYPGDVTVTLGYEPQWVMVKNATQSSNWVIYDNLRGMPATGSTGFNTLAPDSTAAENGVTGSAPGISPTATGFIARAGLTAVSGSAGDTIIYVAIRRGPMKTPTVGTTVFKPTLITATQSTQNVTGVGFSPDLIINGVRSNANYGQQVTDRLRGVTKQVFTEYDSAENTTNGTALVSLNMDGFTLGSDSAGTGWNAYSGYTSVKWNFKRAPSYFDEVCYTGTGSATTQTHNLSVAPELVFVKSRSGVRDWVVYSSALGATNGLYLNQPDAAVASSGFWNNTAPTSSVFTVNTNVSVNGSGSTYVAYLFATAAGVSKVGSYTGTAALQTINCGFASGSRFVLIKRTDSTGDWYVWDSARGLSSGSDPYLLWNTAAAEVTGTNYVDTTAVGFQVTAAAPAGINASGGTYIFLAIA